MQSCSRHGTQCRVVVTVSSGSSTNGTRYFAGSSSRFQDRKRGLWSSECRRQLRKGSRHSETDRDKTAASSMVFTRMRLATFECQPPARKISSKLGRNAHGLKGMFMRRSARVSHIPLPQRSRSVTLGVRASLFHRFGPRSFFTMLPLGRVLGLCLACQNVYYSVKNMCVFLRSGSHSQTKTQEHDVARSIHAL